MSYDHASVALPAPCPTVTTNAREPRTPLPVKHRAAVVDSHTVLSHAVDPSRAPALYVACPKPDPCTVTLADPVPGPLLRVGADRYGMSTDHASVALPTCMPTVTDIRLLPPTPAATKHRMEVVASQPVCSQAVDPSRAPALYVACPKPDPCTVTLADPVPGPLLRVGADRYGMSTDHASVALPTCMPTVTDIRLLPPTPAATKHRMEVVASQPVCSHDVSPTRTPAVWSP